MTNTKRMKSSHSGRNLGGRHRNKRKGRIRVALLRPRRLATCFRVRHSHVVHHVTLHWRWPWYPLASGFRQTVVPSNAKTIGAWWRGLWLITYVACLSTADIASTLYNRLTSYHQVNLRSGVEFVDSADTRSMRTEIWRCLCSAESTRLVASQPEVKKRLKQG